MYTSVVDRFVGLFYEDGWLVPGFHWIAWTETHEAWRLDADPEAMDGASQ